MRLRALFCASLLAACGGHKHERPQPPPAPVESDLDARRAYENPGGMWMPSQMPLHDATLKKLGVKISGEALSDPLRAPLAAVVSLGGCTGSFVSPEGLIVTNHHCAQSALQLNSTPADNLVVNGFVAKTKADEKPAGPAQRVLVLTSYKDVTKEMRDGLVAGEPDKFVMPRASDLRYNWIVVNLHAIDRDELQDLLEEAWRMVVPKSVAQAFLGD